MQRGLMRGDGWRAPLFRLYLLLYTRIAPSQQLLSALLAPPGGVHFYAPPLPAGKHNPKRHLQPQ